MVVLAAEATVEVMVGVNHPRMKAIMVEDLVADVAATTAQVTSAALSGVQKERAHDR
jgi:hypothetical protein